MGARLLESILESESPPPPDPTAGMTDIPFGTSFEGDEGPAELPAGLSIAPLGVVGQNRKKLGGDG